jgi:acetyl esterase/lipase
MIDLWPAEAPGEKGDIGPEKLLESDPKFPIQRLTNVTRPTLALYPSPVANRSGAAVIICPGGGYHVLAMDLEGDEVARRLNAMGVTGIDLKYRVPKREGRPKHEAAAQDVQRAIRIVRGKAKEWEIDPNRLGVLGFSAGAHAAAVAATQFDQRLYQPVDAIDRESARPSFLALIYPGYIADKGELAPEIRVTEATPPTFFAHAHDDRVSPENSVLMYLALKRASVAAELHVYATGGHGYGLRPSEHACVTWPDRFADWLKTQGAIDRSSTAATSK